MTRELKPSFLSIVMPVYNREAFLEVAISKIKSQTINNWELIIVNDGSSDESLSLAKKLTSDIALKTTIIMQTNMGPGAARQVGVGAASGEYIAFYDSDDEWFPDHLEICYKHLISNPDIHWVFTALKRVNVYTNEVLEKHSFYNEKGPKKFQELKTKSIHGLKIFKDKRTALFSIEYGIEACFQCSVIRKSVFDKLSISAHRIGEDRLFITHAIKKGFTLAYADLVTVKYNIHDNNISDTNKKAEVDSRAAKNHLLVDSYVDSLKVIDNLSIKEKLALRNKIANELFWGIGYSLYWNNHEHSKAFKYYLMGLKYNIYNLKFYKTLVICLFKYLLAPK